MRTSPLVSALVIGLTAALLGAAAPAVARPTAAGDELVGGWYALSWTSTPTLYQVSKEGTLTAVGSTTESLGVAGFDVDASNGRALFPTYQGAGALWEVDLATGAFTKLADSNFSAATAFDIGNNGELWVAADNLGGTRGFGTIDPVTGQATRLADGPARIAALATAPNGVLYAFTYGNAVYTYAPDTNEFTHVIDLSVSILAADFDTDGTVLLQSWDGTLTRYDIATGTTTTLFTMSDSTPGFVGEAFSVAGPTDGRTMDEVLKSPAVDAPAQDLDLSLKIGLGDQVAGGLADVTATGLQSGASWTLTVRSTPQVIASGVVVDGGALTTSAALPAGLAAGWHSLTLDSTFADGQPAVARLWFRVAADGTLAELSSTQPTLPATGAESLTVGWVAAGLLLAGGLIAAARARASRRAAAQR